MRDTAFEEATTQFRVNPHVRIIFCTDDEVLVKHGIRSRFSILLRDDGRTKLLGRLLRASDTTVSLAQLLESGVISESELPDAEALVQYLRKRKVLIDPRLSITEAYLNSIQGVSASQTIESVGLIGAGPLGIRIARTLGRIGVRKVHVLDHRAPARLEEAADAWTGAPAREGELPQDYSAAALEALSDTGIDLYRVGGELSSRDAIESVFDAAAFVVVALEHFAPGILHSVNEVALSVETPWLHVSIDGSEGAIGPVFVPGETLCYSEYEFQREAAVGLKDEYLLYREHMQSVGNGAALSPFPPFLDIVGGYASIGALQFLVGAKCFLVERAMLIDFESLTIDMQNILRLPRCPACSSRRPAYTHLFL